LCAVHRGIRRDFIAQNADGTVNASAVYNTVFGDRDYQHPQVDGQIDFT